VKNHYGCPVSATINAVSGKWKVQAIWHLGFGAKRFAQLRRLLSGVSEKVLTSQLRELESAGIVNREVKHASPPQVTYSLTRAGEELLDPMSLLCNWGTRHLGVTGNMPRNPRVQGAARRQLSVRLQTKNQNTKYCDERHMAAIGRRVRFLANGTRSANAASVRSRSGVSS